MHETHPPDDPPYDPDVPTCRRGGSRKAGSIRRATKMKSNGLARPDEARTRKASSTGSTRGTREPGREPPGLITMVKGANARAGMADKACAIKANRDALHGQPP